MSGTRRNRVTLKDVAAVAGVTPATVSYALNDSGGVSPQTRERVRRIAAELGYRPNAAARSLVTGRTGLLGIAPSVDESYLAFLEVGYLADVVAGVTRRSTTLGHPLVVIPAARVDDLWDHLPVDGVIVVDPVVDDRRVAELVSREIPLVSIDRDLMHPEVPYVDNGVDAGTRAVLDHLRDQGARQVALVSWEVDDAFRLDSEAAYLSWAEENGQPALLERWPRPRLGVPRTLITALVERPDVDAIYCLSQPYGSTVLEVARDVGRDVPGELLVASARDFRITDPETFPLTTLEFRPAELGAAAVDLLVEVLDGPAVPQRPRSVPAMVQVRRSSLRRSR